MSSLPDFPHLHVRNCPGKKNDALWGERVLIGAIITWVAVEYIRGGSLGSVSFGRENSIFVLLFFSFLISAVRTFWGSFFSEGNIFEILLDYPFAFRAFEYFYVSFLQAQNMRSIIPFEICEKWEREEQKSSKMDPAKMEEFMSSPLLKWVSVEIAKWEKVAGK